MAENRHPVSLREGAVSLDGTKIMSAVKFKVVAIPKTAEAAVLGDQTPSTRWIGMSYRVEISEYKSTPWMEEALKKYKDTRRTPEFTVQGIQDDPGSDYQQENGVLTVTATGCVMTSEIPLLELDTDGELIKRDITMAAKNVVM